MLKNIKKGRGGGTSYRHSMQYTRALIIISLKNSVPNLINK